jgi:hypothetical protein
MKKDNIHLAEKRLSVSLKPQSAPAFYRLFANPEILFLVAFPLYILFLLGAANFHIYLNHQNLLAFYMTTIAALFSIQLFVFIRFELGHFDETPLSKLNKVFSRHILKWMDTHIACRSFGDSILASGRELRYGDYRAMKRLPNSTEKLHLNS